MADTAAIEKAALLWRMGAFGVLDAPKPDAETAALLSEADALVRGEQDEKPYTPAPVGNIFNVFSGKGNGVGTLFPFSMGDEERPLPYPMAKGEAAPADMETVR